MSKEEESSQEFYLELGDIIKINAPENKIIDQSVFFIDYLDENIARLIHPDSLETTVLNIKDGEFQDETIESIEIINKPSEKGYARQNNLITGTNITVQIGGDIPLTINGQITDLDEDMIEITTYDDDKKIYIDFAYKGIPLYLPITSITLFEPPKKEILKTDEIPDLDMDMSTKDDILEEEDEEAFLSEEVDTDVKTRLKSVILDADEISFGESLEEVTEFIRVGKANQRFGLVTQTNDLLDDLLSTIPTNERSPAVLNKIHVMIERFKQLREMYSVLTDDGVDKPKIKTANYKPLVERFEKLNAKLYWLIPIVKNRLKLYNINEPEDADNDFISETLFESQTEINRLMEEFKNNQVPDGQNKYNYLYQQLNNLLTPFENPNDKTNVITEQKVETNLFTMTDNLQNFYSNVAKDENVERCLYVPTQYSMGLTHLHSTDLKKPLKTAKMQSLTNNDTISINGFISLPAPAVVYSHIQLPNTSILFKSHLNQLIFNYFSLLNKSSSVNVVDIPEESLKKGTSKSIKDNDKFLKNINAFMFNESTSFYDKDSNSYREFLDTIVPRTRSLFENVKKYILHHHHGVSYKKVVEYLEPFLVYYDDITFKQYETIVKFMEEQILELKKLIVTQTVSVKRFLQYQYSTTNETDLFNSVLFKLFENGEIYKFYNVTDPITTGELLKKMIDIDDMRLFSTALALQDKDLYQPIDIENILEKTNQQLEDNIASEENKADKECKNFVLAKKYIDIEELRDDDNTNEVFFDEKYDTTRYDINSEFRENKEIMDNDEYREFIFRHLKEAVGLTESHAIIESEALSKGKRRISAGDYAFLEDVDGHSIYFKRVDETGAYGKWVKDDSLDGMSPNDPEMFCNIKNACFSINKQCADTEINKTKIAKNLTSEMVEQLDLEFNMKYRELISKLNVNLRYFTSIIPNLKLINLYKFLKNDLNKQKIGDSLKDREVIISPYATLRDYILSQSDFVEKQNNILLLISKVCREASTFGEDPENEYWYYCKTTGVPLLPTFYGALAEAFQRGQYTEVLDRVVANRGQISDDGDKIVDKHSGYVIRFIDYDRSEGFDEAGYRIVSREVLEKDIGDVITELTYKQPNSMKTPDANMILRVLVAMDKSVSINISSEYDFIINNVSEAIMHFIGSKQSYMKKVAVRAKKGKRTVPYEKAHDETLIILTMGYYLIAIQTMIPSVITQKTFPGCVRSFQGFPLQEDGDGSALMYLVCVLLKLRQSARPWSVLPRLSKKKEEAVSMAYVEKIKKRMESIVLDKSIVRQKLETKRAYLESNIPTDDIPELFNVKQWLTFLPPLFPVKTKPIQNVGPQFKNTLLGSINSGSKNQHIQIDALQGKMIAFSLHIQELIQRVVNREAPLLKNLSDEPLLENACCNIGIRETLKYFADKESGILKYNNDVRKLEDIMKTVKQLQTAGFIFSPLDTRLKYPKLSDKFSETTIYASFLRFCNMDYNFDQQISRICDSPVFKIMENDISISDKIDFLKKQGVVVSTGLFNQVLLAVNKKNIVDISLHNIVINERKLLEIKIAELKQKGNVTLCNKEILDAFMNLFDTYESISSKKTENYIAMETFLDENIEYFQDKIIEFMKSMNVTKNVEKFFDDMINWKLKGEEIYISKEDETSVTISSFYTTFVTNMLDIYPNIIIEGVNYKDVQIPKNWKLSERHQGDVKKSIFNEVSSLQKFYKDSDLIAVLKYIQTQGKDLISLMKTTALFADLIFEKGSSKKSLINANLLNKLTKFYVLCTMFIYINATQQELEEEGDIIEPSEMLLSLVDNEGFDDMVRDQIIEGKRDEVNKKIANLLGTYVNMMLSQKKKLDMNNEDIIKNVLKSKEKEKNKVTKRLGDLTVEEREIENILKNQRLGDWSLGQTRALFEYDKEQYDKERQEIDEDMLMELKLDKNNDVTERNREIYRLEEMDEQVQRERVNDELLESFRAMPEDDDYGERDGDEYY